MQTAASNATILIVDDSSLCRDMLTKSLHAEGLSTVAAVDGMEGLAQLGQRRIDAIILDNEMPKMGGVAFLKALRSDSRWKNLPVLMLTTTVAREVIVEATQYGLNGYLLKARLCMPDMITRLRQALAKPAGRPAKPLPTKKPLSVEKLSVPGLVTRDATLDAITQISAARTLCGVVSQITSIANSPKASMSDLSAVVKQDPLLCVRIVQLAGSAAYGGPKVRLGSVEDAVRAVGVAAVRDLAISMAVFQAFPMDKPDGADLLRCWRHSLAVASIMDRIVPKTDTISPGFPYLIGLCHDLAEILLRQRFPAEFAAAQDYGRQAECPATDVVRQVFGISYAEVTETLFERLKLPATITAPINEFAFHANRTADTHPNVLARSLSIANFLAHGMLCTSSPDSLVAPVLQTDCHTALISTSAINLAEIRSESTAATCILANAGPDLQAALMKPLLPRNEVKVWYVRHPSLAALDPIEAALQCLCQVESHERLPQGEELFDIKAFVFASPRHTTAISEAHRLCALGGKSLPILNIVRSENESGDNRSGAEELEYPVSLNRLMRFISTLHA